MGARKLKVDSKSVYILLIILLIFTYRNFNKI